MNDQVLEQNSVVSENEILESKNSNGFFNRCWKFLKTQKGWLFILPAFILMCIFTFYPIISSFITAFREGYDPINSIKKDEGFGFGNFTAILTNDYGNAKVPAEFLLCLENTLIFAFISVPLSIVIALLISVALNSIKVLQKAYQTIFFLPYLTNSLAMGAVFASLFNVIQTNPYADPVSVGFINKILGVFGIEPVNWINVGSSLAANRFVVIFYDIWNGLPFKILILFSALQNVNKQYYDAAKVDGANKSTILRKITVPLISPMLSYLLITGIMGGLKSYSGVVGIFGDKMGPMDNYEVGTMVGYIYTAIQSKGGLGVAAAGSLILFAIIMVFTAINSWLSKKRVHY